MTMMVRDEADIIEPVIRHNLSQGIDLMIVTDNGSIDGTTEILEQFAGNGVLELRHDPVHLKQQHSTVTAMAREAAIRGADWVLNVDADEFWFPVGAGLLADVPALLPADLKSFKVDVWDMTGAPAEQGTGLQRLVYRDLRDHATMQRLGLHAHATPDLAHIGDPRVTVGQGNHFSSLPVGTPPAGIGFEVLHFPWRSWAQFERKVANSGRAYERNPNLLPSPNHHGMREYRRFKRGGLVATYVLRHPDPVEIATRMADGSLLEDRRVAEAWRSPVADVPLNAELEQVYREFGSVIVDFERQIAALERDVAAARAAARASDERTAAVERELAGTRAALQAQLERRVVKLADSIARTTKGRG